MEVDTYPTSSASHPYSCTESFQSLVPESEDSVCSVWITDFPRGGPDLRSVTDIHGYYQVVKYAQACGNPDEARKAWDWVMRHDFFPGHLQFCLGEIAPEGLRAAFEAKSRHQKVTQLELLGAKLDDTLMKTLARSIRHDSDLQELHFKSCTFFASPAALEELLESVRTHEPAIHTLSLRSNRLPNGEPGMLAEYWQVLSSFIGKAQHLESFVSDGQFISPEAAQCLADGLKKNKSLEAIELTRCNFGNEQLALLLSVLQTGCPKLDTLSLRENSLSGLAAGLLLEKLIAEHPGLKRLDISMNPLGGQGVRYLTEALGKNERLVDFGCAFLDLTDAEYATLLGALAKRAGIKKLKLGNDWDAKGWAALITLIEKSKGLKQLDLGQQALGARRIKHLKQALAKHSTIEKVYAGGAQLHLQGNKKPR
ncbi:MAG: hypothetical protein KDK78_01220 [Chlamydiia bacterium]|nr:hypothetical protein [Chlamydiia bacterium]